MRDEVTAAVLILQEEKIGTLVLLSRQISGEVNQVFHRHIIAEKESQREVGT